MESLYNVFKRRGYTRRDFLKSALLIASTIGMGPSFLPQVVKALESKPKPQVLWLSFQSCLGCTQSILNSTSIVPADVLSEYISLEYHETLMFSHRSKEAMDLQKGRYVLVLEGSLPVDGGFYCTGGGRSAEEILKSLMDGAGLILALGSCASWGGIAHAEPNPTKAVAVDEILKHKRVVKLPGCPPVGDVIVSVIASFVVTGRPPEVDGEGRPRVFYGQTIHDRCYRRPFYDAGKFVGSFEGEDAQRGYCLYRMGCKGPITRNACATVRWNGGLSFPIQSGHPCFGCSEADFWDRGFIYRPLSVVEEGFSWKEALAGALIGTALGYGTAYINKKLGGG